MQSARSDWRTAFSDHRTLRAPITHTASTSVAFVLAVALFLVARRLTGAISEPLHPAVFVVTVAVLMAWAWCVRAARGAPSRWIEWGPTFALALFAVACSHRAVDWLIWGVVIAGDWWLQWTARPRLVRQSVLAAPRPSTERVLQQLTRSRSATGEESIRGTLMAEFAAGERNATLYAAFCPPLEHVPQVAANATDGPAATVKIVQALHNGVQFDVRLARAADQPQCVSVELSAKVSPPLAV